MRLHQPLPGLKASGAHDVILAPQPHDLPRVPQPGRDSGWGTAPCCLYQRDSRTGRHFDGQLDLKFTSDPGTAASNIPVFLSTTAGILASLAQLRIEKFEESYGRTSGLCYYSRTESAKIPFDGGGVEV